MRVKPSQKLTEWCIYKFTVHAFENWLILNFFFFDFDSRMKGKLNFFSRNQSYQTRLHAVCFYAKKKKELHGKLSEISVCRKVIEVANFFCFNCRKLPETFLRAHQKIEENLVGHLQMPKKTSEKTRNLSRNFRETKNRPKCSFCFCLGPI